VSFGRQQRDNMISKEYKAKKILSGCRVLDFSTLISGPYCASLLGDMGAEVIKVELPKTGDGLRHLGFFIEGESTLFLAVNRNKRGITLALDRPEGGEILDRLIARADVVVENFRPDIRARYGLEYGRVCQVKPDIIYLSITAFGERGPYRLKPGTDHVFQGLSGIMSISGEPGQGPMRVGVPIADMTAALYGAFGVVNALYHRERTGQGQLVAINLLDAAMCLQGTQITEYFLTGREPVSCGNDSPFAYPVGVFKTTDGYIAISAFNDKFWKGLCRALDLDTLVSDERFNTGEKRFSNREMLRPILQQRFDSGTTAGWLAALEKEDVPCGPVHTYHGLFKDPQVLENALVKGLFHPGLGEVRTVGNPLRLSRTHVMEERASPLLGEHTRAVLAELGYSDSDIQDFSRHHII